MEIKLRKWHNILLRVCEEVAVPKGAEAHTLGNTGLDNVEFLTSQNPIGLHGLLRG
jgi:hypothetical protein